MNGKDHGMSMVPFSPEKHFILNLYAALFFLFNYMHKTGTLEGRTGTFSKFSFLEKYLAEIMIFVPEEKTWEEGLIFFEKTLIEWEKSCPVHLPLLSLCETRGFDFQGRMALMIIGMVEEDSRFGTVIAGLQQPLAHRRLCLETVEQIVSGNDGNSHNVCTSLLSVNVAEVLNPDEPRSEWVLRISPLLWDVIKGNVPAEPATWCRYHSKTGFLDIRDLLFDNEFKMKLENVPSLLTNKYVDAIILRGMHGEPRLSVMGSIARSMDMGIIEIRDVSHMTRKDLDILGSLCIMLKSMPVIILDTGPGETIAFPEINGTFFGIVMGNEGGVRGENEKKTLTLSLPLPDAAYRRRCWKAAISGFPVKELDTIIDRFHMPGDNIRRVFEIAKANILLSGRKSLKAQDVREAASTLNRQILDTLAVRIESNGSWDQLVVSNGVNSRLAELEIRCKNRDKIDEHLKSGYGKNPGVRAIFTGMSGTGKTMAAKILASRLGMDIYRVDLAALVNKYIGETEKNLHRVLSRAEELDVILLLDESDALLGSRTEIRSANDRYANLETDYLLQRLENYQGILIMTTNTPENIDSAFQRRMDVVVNFIQPQANERLKIWKLHLQKKNKIPPDYLEDIAHKCAMTGGQIKNAALYATLLAIEDGGFVTSDHLVKAVDSEYRKAGSSSPNKETNRVQVKGMESFIELIRGE